MAKIISINKLDDRGYHPAVGYSYEVILSDNRKGIVDDDTFLGMYMDLRVPEFNSEMLLARVIGRDWDDDINLD